MPNTPLMNAPLLTVPKPLLAVLGYERAAIISETHFWSGAKRGREYNEVHWAAIHYSQWCTWLGIKKTALYKHVGWLQDKGLIEVTKVPVAMRPLSGNLFRVTQRGFAFCKVIEGLFHEDADLTQFDLEGFNFDDLDLIKMEVEEDE